MVIGMTSADVKWSMVNGQLVNGLAASSSARTRRYSKNEKLYYIKRKHKKVTQ